MWLDGTGRGAFFVVIERGQSLESIARTYRVAKRDIIATNQLAAPYNLKPGTQLEVPLDKRHKKVPAWSSSVGKAATQSKMTRASTAVRHAKIKRRETTVTSLHRPKAQEPSPQKRPS
jgi:LysM repeat protein